MNKWKMQMLRRRYMDENVEAAAAGGGEVSGGVGNGQATGTGQVSDTFDKDAAINSISESLFGSEEKPNEAKEPTTEAATPPAEKEETPVEPTPVPGAVAPKTWKPEEQAVWAQIPEAAKAAIMRREEDMYRGIEQYKAPAEFGKSVKAILAPFEQIMEANRMDPVVTIQNLLQAHHTLATASPLQKTEFLHKLAKDYGVTLAAPEGDAYNPLPDPEVIRLREELHALQSTTQNLTQQRYEEVRQQKANEVSTFAADPKNVHFEKVAEIMIPLLKDPKMSLQQAYEQAVWQHPEVRELEIARIASEKQAKAIADGKAAAAAASKAQAANVKVGPKAGAAVTPLGTMDDTMNETLARIRAG